MSARDARTGVARDSSVGGEPPGRDPVPSDGLVIGSVPLAARCAGGLLVLAGVLGLTAVFPTYLTVGGQQLSHATGVVAVLAGWLVPLASTAVGVLLVRGSVPKFGLAYAPVAGALATGHLLIEIYLGSPSTARPAIEVIAGERVLTSSVEVGAGWMLGIASLAITMLAGLVAVVSWGRTVMDDAGTLDPHRPTLAGASLLLGVVAVLSLTLPAADVPDRIVLDPGTGLQTVVAQQGPQALLERPGLALLGGLLLAGAVVLCSVLAPSLRPRLAAVGGALALAVTVFAAGLGGLADAAGSDALEWTVPGAGLLLTGLGYIAVTVVAERAGRPAGRSRGRARS